MRIGVVPFCTVVGPPMAVGTKLPIDFRCAKYLMPGSMLPNEPPFASAAA